MDGKVTCSWVQGSHTTDRSKSITFSAEPGSFGAIESNKDSCPPELGCGWPEPGSPARPCRALKSNTSNNTGRERATPSQFVSRCGQELQQEHWLWARAVAHALFPAGPSMRDDDDDGCVQASCTTRLHRAPPALRSAPTAGPTPP
jgi:hypothetical protein